MPVSGKATDATMRERSGVQAMETGLQVLTAFIGAETRPMLKTIAERSGMHPAKVHRYLVSLCRMGFVEQDPESGRYGLAEASLRLGYAAMNAVDVLRIARPLMVQICRSVGHSAVLATWGTSGATVALQEFVPGPIAITATVGSALPLLRSSSGRTFAAWLPREKIANLLTDELAFLRAHPQPDCPTSLADAEVLLKEIRKRGMARVRGQLNAAIHALTVPVFDGSGEITAALSAIGSATQFDSSWTGSVAVALLAAADSMSRTLGYQYRIA